MSRSDGVGAVTELWRGGGALCASGANVARQVPEQTAATAGRGGAGGGRMAGSGSGRSSAAAFVELDVFAAKALGLSSNELRTI
jgi:hypothetical protein